MNKKISEYLVELRLKKGLTQLELGKELGMSRSKVSSWEIGRRDISVSDAVIISDYFNISLEHILNPEGMTNEKIIDVMDLYIKNSKTSFKDKTKIIEYINENLEKELVSSNN